MSRTLLGLIATLAGVLLLVGLTFSAATDELGEFRFVNGTEPKSLDPHLTTGQPGGRVLDAIFEGLTRRDARTLNPAPGVAESWDISSDGKLYTFHLRDDAQWSDGTALTAEDFVYSWRRLLAPETAAEYAYILFMIAGAEIVNTYAAHASALEAQIPKALTGLGDQPDGKAWQRFLAEYHVHDVLRPVLRDLPETERIESLLSPEQQRLTSADLAAFGSATQQAAQLLRAALASETQNFGKTAGIYAKDPRTFVVELKAPTPYFLEVTSFYATFPAPRHVVEAEGNSRDWFLPGKIVSNGPYLLASWHVNDRIRLLRNDRYWGKDEVKNKSIDVLPIENPTTALNLYLTGAVDWLPGGSYPQDLSEHLRTRPDFYAGPGLVVYFYRFNCKRKPLNDPRVREAINLAVDRREIVEEVLGLGQLPAARIVPPGMPGYEPPDSHVKLNAERARALLSDAGFPEGKGFPEMGILYNTSEAHKKIAEVIADQLRDHLGITVRAYNQEWQSYLATTRALDFDLARGGWIGDYNDPNTFLDMWVTNGGNNNTGFSSALYDRLINAAGDIESFLRSGSAGIERLLARLKEPRRAKALLERTTNASSPDGRRLGAEALRMHLLREAEAVLFQDEFPVLPVYFYTNSDMVSPDVRGFYSELEYEDGSKGPNLQGLHPLRDVWHQARSSFAPKESPSDVTPEGDAP